MNAIHDNDSSCRCMRSDEANELSIKSISGAFCSADSPENYRMSPEHQWLEDVFPHGNSPFSGDIC